MYELDLSVRGQQSRTWEGRTLVLAETLILADNGRRGLSRGFRGGSLVTGHGGREDREIEGVWVVGREVRWWLSRTKHRPLASKSLLPLRTDPCENEPSTRRLVTSASRLPSPQPSPVPLHLPPFPLWPARSLSRISRRRFEPSLPSSRPVLRV